MPESEKITFWVYEYQGLKTVQGHKYWKAICASQKVFDLIAEINNITSEDKSKYLDFRFVRKKYVARDNGVWLKKTNTITEIMPDYVKSKV